MNCLAWRLMVALLLGCPSLAWAQTFTWAMTEAKSFTWTASVVDASNTAPVTYKVKCGTVAGAYPLFFSVPASAVSTPVGNVIKAPGSYFCVVTALNASGESAPSNQITVQAVTGVNPPAGLKVVP
jgi:hypothetical protein